MELPTHLLLLHGYWLIFGWVLLCLIGVPIPVTPTLLAAGALSSDGDMNLSYTFIAGLAACISADVTWYFIGRRYGSKVLRLLCKITMQPANCIRVSEGSVGRRAALVFLYAKFIPGLSSLASPIAGQRRMKFYRFLFYDALGSALWLGAFLYGGRVFGKLLQQNPHIFDWVGRFSGLLLLAGLVGFFLFRIYRRHRLLHALAAARLDPLELKLMLDAGEEVYIVDLRNPSERIDDAHTLPGAHLVAPGEIASHSSNIPLDRDIILFCSCPNEAAAAQIALKLQKQGIDRVRPLRGGYDEWKRLGLPLEAVAA